MSDPHTSSISSSAARRFAGLTFVTGFFTYALIVFGGIVRITGSGMGCGDDWPLCNGQLIPPMDFETLIEYGHRLAALFVSLLVFVVAGYAWRHRRSPPFANRGVAGLAGFSAVLLIVQVLVGAITVWLELPTGTVVLHLILASTLLAVLIVAGLRALVDPCPHSASPITHPRWAARATIMGFVLLVFGAMVANSGASPLCQGFPLCNGQVVPSGSALVHLHWTHRLLAYVMVPIVVTAVVVTIRQRAPAAVVGAGLIAAGLVVAQIWVGAAMVLARLPASLRGAHLAVGAALWAVLVAWATLARRLPQTRSHSAAASS